MIASSAASSSRARNSGWYTNPSGSAGSSPRSACCLPPAAIYSARMFASRTTFAHLAVRLRQRLRDIAIEARDQVFRGRGRHGETEPVRDLIAGHARLGGGWHLRQQRGALGAQDRQRVQPALLDVRQGLEKAVERERHL